MIDINSDDVFGSGDVFLNGEAVAGDNVVRWNGVDNSGHTITNGSYKAQIILKTGEFHFTAWDAETSGGPNFDGLTINAVLDDGSIDTSTKVYWDDKTVLGLTNSKAYNTDGQYKYHNWGTHSSSGYGNEAYLDTYAVGTIAAPVFANLAIEPNDDPLIKMQGNIFDDANGNGVRDSGENGLANITIAIIESSGTFYVSTDNNGTYVAYTKETSITIDVNESMLPAGYMQTAGTDPETVDVSAGGTINVGYDGYQNNDTPIAHDDSKETMKDSPVSISVLSNDYDTDGDTLTIAVMGTSTNGAPFTTSNGGVVTWNANGTVVYTPAPGYTGIDTFEYTITDGNGHNAHATITVTVLPADEPAPAPAPEDEPPPAPAPEY
jgi:hypothetical protein